jgi:glycerol uptake facilitator protein
MLPLVAEFFGTLILMLFGEGVNAMTTLFGTGAPAEIVKGGYTDISLAWGLGVMLGIYVANRYSGAHLNPAVTLSLAVFRGFSWKKVLPYMAAQFLGAFCAAALVYWNYRPAFHAFDPSLEKTAGVFSTFPAFPAIPMAGLFDQILGTAILMFVILAIGEATAGEATNLAPILVGLLVVAIGMAFGGMHGYAINPARDFGPRVFTALAGFKNNGLTDGSMVFWVPIVGPLLGGLIGTAAHDYGLKRLAPQT